MHILRILSKFGVKSREVAYGAITKNQKSLSVSNSLIFRVKENIKLLFMFVT